MLVFQGSRRTNGFLARHPLLAIEIPKIVAPTHLRVYLEDPE